MRVLLVDDRETVARALATLLARRFEVTVATDPRDAVVRLAQQPFDAVISDYDLRGSMTGLDVLAHARQLWPASRRILLSARTPTGFASHVASGLVAFFLGKPASGDDVFRALEAGRTANGPAAA